MDADVFMLHKFQNDDFLAFKLLSFEICFSFFKTQLSLSEDLRIEDGRLTEMMKEKWDTGFYD